MGTLLPGNPMAEIDVLAKASVTIGRLLMNTHEFMADVLKVVADDGLAVLDGPEDDDENLEDEPKPAGLDLEFQRLVDIGKVVTAAQYAARQRVQF